LSFGIIFGLIASEQNGGNVHKGNPDEQPHKKKKTRREREDDEWLAWILSTSVPPETEGGA